MRTKSLLTLVAALLMIGGCGDATVDELEPETQAPETDTEAPETDTEAPETDTEAPETDTEATEEGYSAACGDAVSQLAQLDDLQAAADDLDDAIATCESPEAMQAAVDDNLNLDVPIDPLIAERCADVTADDDVLQSAICAELS